jgi:hypothetical protein
MFNVFYDNEHGAKVKYCLQDSDLTTMQRMLNLLKQRYMNDDGTPNRPYPNGKGVYHVYNPRIESV